MRSIVLLPLGTADRDAVEGLRRPLTKAFEARIEVRELPLDLNQFYDGQRVQYNSTQIVALLSERLKNPGHTFPGVNAHAKLLAILPHDLHIPILTFVFGEAELGGRVAVVSYHRLLNERYGLPPNPELFALRLRKESLHELGHTYGLLHCDQQECVMHASTDVEDIDIKGGMFCEACQEVLGGVR